MSRNHCHSKIRTFVVALALFLTSYGTARADDSKPSFQVTNRQIDHLVGSKEPDEEYLQVQNTGKAAISELTYQGEFTDPKSGSKIQIPPTAAVLPEKGLQAGDQTFVKITMCRPVWAGNYTGALVLSSPGADWKSIGVNIRSRGPIPNLPFSTAPFYQFPTILFVIAVIFGFGVSWLLDQWVGTDLPRLRALQSLRNSQTTLADLADRIRKWSVDHPSLSAFPLTTNRLAILIPDLTRVISAAGQSAPAELSASAQTYGLIAAKVAIFSSALDLIESMYNQKGNDPSNLAYVNSSIARLDALDISDSSQVGAFRASVVTALSPSSGTMGAPAAPISPDSGIAQTAQVEAGQKKIERDIRLIMFAQQAVIWVVVVLTAFTTYFLASATYGSAQDYVGTLLWSLGLTQTGKQIVARTH